MITVPQGEILEIEIYNAARAGPITFGISFSGASALVSAAATLAALSIFTFWKQSPNQAKATQLQSVILTLKFYFQAYLFCQF